MQCSAAAERERDRGVVQCSAVQSSAGAAADVEGDRAEGFCSAAAAAER